MVQFTTEEGRNAALKFNKTEWKGKLIYVNASRFALLPTTAVEEGVKDGTGEQSTSIVDIPSPPAVHDVLPQQAIVEEQVAAKPAVKENPYLAHQQEEKSDVKKPDVAKKLTSLTTTMFKPRGLNKSK